MSPPEKYKSTPCKQKHSAYCYTGTYTIYNKIQHTKYNSPQGCKKIHVHSAYIYKLIQFIYQRTMSNTFSAKDAQNCLKNAINKEEKRF